jgi:hypothetical protein
LVTSYNAMLTSRRTALADVEKRYAAGWRAGGVVGWQDRYDGQITRAYNFYGQSFARAGFCAAATQAIAELARVTDEAFPPVAAQQLATIERPFDDFFTAYAAWRGEPQPVMALAAPVPVTPALPAPVRAESPVVSARVAPVSVAPAVVAPVVTSSASVPPVLTVDPRIFTMP